MSPVQSVLASLKEGATSRAEVARRCSLQPATVDAVIEFLERSGRLTREEMRSCAGNCSSCAISSRCGRGRGPVLLKLEC
ncbi:hypothetical protein HMPREF1219_02161 [Corynebacterium pyruviciproducens ATCC BAA-1742]|uniref:Transcriptional regulator HTH-type FeoC domain-containing protein n=1 Tax=Corynebacterium pyruviciproducens ATCC BAA-1742 TaxID=1125779 RepID=S2YTM4_9CORY|nr:FeoC-like transcriptional regulator [Corynebacterium pyruviciproducens]EPD67748.1 hypothetical protein HMPREF1219_02161 [Corynebacterium pyruviciproducens ATCC BAA-1742]